MELGGNLFSTTTTWIVLAFDFLVLALAIWFLPWRRLAVSGRVHGFFVAVGMMIMLWYLRTDVVTGLRFHLLGVTSLTLMLGGSLAIIGATLAMVGVILIGKSDWSNFPLSFITLILAPVSLTYLSLILVRAYLPKHFIVYVFANAFVTGGLVGTLCGFLSIAILVLSGTHTFSYLQDTVIPFFPIMFFPEAVFNGWMMTLLVVYKPEWVYSFIDKEYLDGK